MILYNKKEMRYIVDKIILIIIRFTGNNNVARGEK
jgi:hypothetical protein